MAHKVKRYKVCGSSISDAGSVAKQAFDFLFKLLDKFLTCDGFEIKNTKDIKKDGREGKQILYEVGDHGDTVTVDLFVTEDNPDTFTVEIHADGCKPFRKEKVPKNKIMKYVVDYADTNDLGSVEGEVSSSKKLQVCLKRVCSSTEDTINLVAVNANYSPTDAMNDLDFLLDSEEFVNSITSDNSSFEITQTEDAFDVKEIEAVDTDRCYEVLLGAAAHLMFDIQAIHWGAKGTHFDALHGKMDNLVWHIRNDIDTIAEWMVEQTGRVPHIGNVYERGSVLDVSQGFTYTTGLSNAQQLLREYIELLEFYYVNMPHDIQSVMDNWIRDYKQDADYFMERPLQE